MRRTGVAITAAMIAGSGCASILSEYEAARDEALADPGPAPANWEPDAVLHLSLPLLNEVVRAALDETGALTGQQRIDGPLGLQATLTPDLTVRDLKLVRSQTCSDCLTVIADLVGEVGWSLPPTGGTVPVSIATTFDAGFETTADGPVWTVAVAPTDVKRLEVDIGGVSAALGGVGDDLTAWARDQITKGVPAIPLTRIDATELPLRALSAEPSTKGLRIEMLTRSPSPTPVGERNASPTEGWAFDVSDDSLVDLVRAASFATGPLDYDVVVDPTAMALEGSNFELEVRLWRVQGKGWWRDYSVRGTIAPDADTIALAADAVDEVAQSPGAVFVDPLAALAEGKILDVIAEVLSTSLPASQGANLGGLPASLAVAEVTGKDGVITLRGTLDVGEDEGPAAQQAPARKGRRERAPLR